MITVRTQGKLYRFPDDTPQDVMKGAIDKHIASFQSLKGESTLGGNKPAVAPFDPKAVTIEAINDIPIGKAR